MKTKQEVIDFLESKVGGGVPHPGKPELDSQCVTLIKALMEFLGVPNPYKARGHAKDCISAYLNEGIADPGTGFISVFSNKFMGGGYGHIWCNAGNGVGTYYESNGKKPLLVTKGEVYSYDAVCNFDKYITENGGSGEATEGNNMDDLLKKYSVKDTNELDAKIYEHCGTSWGGKTDGGFLGSSRKRVLDLENENDRLRMDVKHFEEKIEDHVCEAELLLTDEFKIGNTIMIANGATVDDEGRTTVNYEVKK